MTDIISTGIAIDTTSAVKAKHDLEELAGAGGKVDTALAKVDQSSAKTGKSLATLGNYAKQISASNRQAVTELERMNSSQTRQEALLKQLGGGFASLAREIKESTAALQGSGKGFKPYQDELDKTNTKQKAVGVSAAQTAAALRGVPAQFTDIITSLQGGQAPLTVFLQQGGQLKDMFGGAGAAARALGGYVMGLINPFTVGAAATAAFAVAAYQGSQEAQAYAKAIILTGNVAGKTAGDLQAMAAAIAQSNGTQGQAADALAASVMSGKIASEALQSVSSAAVSMSRVLGTSVDDAVASFVKLADEPAKASAKLNEQYHYLDLATYERIRALEEQGRKEEAAGLAQSTYARATIDRLRDVEAQAGSLERGWNVLALGARRAWDAMQGVGREKSTADLLADAQQRVSDTANAAFAPKSGLWDSVRLALGGGAAIQAEANAKVTDLSRKLLGEQERAYAQGERARTEQARIGASERMKVLENEVRTNADKRKKAIADLDKDLKTLGKPTSGVAYDKLVADINDKYKDPKGAKAKDTTRGDNSARAKYDIADIKANAAEVINTIANAERILEATRSAGLTSEAQYYAEKKRLMAANVGAQVDALKAENARLSKDTLNTKDGLDRDSKVLENRQKILKLTTDASTAQAVLDMQAASALRARETALLSARQAAQDYFDSVEQSREVGFKLLGVGGDRRQLEEGIQQIKDRYASQKRELENQRAQAELQGNGSLTEEARKQYDARLAIIAEYQIKSIASYETSFVRMSAAQLDWSIGATRAMDDYFAQSKSVASQVEEAFTSAFKGLEDALVGFVTTGKLDFKSLANSIIADLARIAIKQNITGPLAGALSGIFGGGLSGSSAASVANVIGGDDKLGSMIGLMGLGKKYSEGGYTGAGGKYEPAGLVHAGEFVINAESTRKLGLGFLSSLNGYATGGLVERPSPRLLPNTAMPVAVPRAAQSGGAGQGLVFSPVTNINIDSRTDQAAVYEIANRAVRDAQQGYTDQLKRAGVLPE